jgi:hypothetical protein
MPTPKLHIQLIHTSTLYATSSVIGFELQVKEFNETENTANAHEQSSKDCTETQYTWNCNETLQQIPGTNVANYTAHAEHYKLIATT